MHRQANGVPACFLIKYFYCNQPLEGLLQSRNEQVSDCLHTTSGSFLSFAFVLGDRNGGLLMKTNNSEYELIGEEDGKLIVKVKHMGNQVTTITKVEGNIIFDFDHQQYNSDHRNERHQDKFFGKHSITRRI